MLQSLLDQMKEQHQTKINPAMKPHPGKMATEQVLIVLTARSKGTATHPKGGTTTDPLRTRINPDLMILPGGTAMEQTRKAPTAFMKEKALAARMGLTLIKREEAGKMPVTANEILTGFSLGLSVTSPLIWLAATLLDGLARQKPIAAFLKSKAIFGNTNLTGTLVAPLTEEILKMAVPMLLLFVLNRWRSRPMAKVRTPIDYLILAAAFGAGFSLFENLFRAADGAYSYLWPKLGSEISWAIGPFRLLPEMFSRPFFNGDLIWFGHAGTAAAAGLAIGLFYHTRKRIVTFLLPVTTMLVVIWDHLLWNYGINKSKIWWKPTLGNLTLHGRLLPVLYLVMLIGAMLLVWPRYRWYLGTANARRFPAPSIKGWKGILAYAGRHRYVLMAAFRLHEALHDRKKRALRYAPFVGGLVREASICHDREKDV